MSARVSVGANAGGATGLSDARAGAGGAARAAGLLESGGPVGSADTPNSGSDDAANGTGSGARPFAVALASAARANAPKSSGSAGTAAGAPTADAANTRGGAQSAGAAQSGAAQGASSPQAADSPSTSGSPSAAGSPSPAGSTQTAGSQQTAGLTQSIQPGGGALSTATPQPAVTAQPTGSLPSAAARGVAATSTNPAPVALTGQSPNGGSSEDDNAGVDDATSNDGATSSIPGHTGRHGRSSPSGDTVDGSGNTACGALALLQSVAAAALAAPSLPGTAGATGAANADEDGGDDPAMSSAGSVTVGGTAGAEANLSSAASADAGASVNAAVLASGSTLPGTGALVAAMSGAGNAPVPTHSASSATDALGQSSAAARAATWMPQFLSVVPAAAGSDGVARAIPVPMSDPSWPQALAAQVHWMAGSQVQSATLRLSPEHLGPIQVRIELQQSQINVNFSAAHADTRAALTDAVPRLRDMLAAGGLSLGQASVQQDSPGSGTQTPLSPDTREAVETVDPVAVGVSRALGLVDEYV